MGWIDVAIPGVIGLLLFSVPGMCMKSSGDPDKDAASKRRLRLAGGVLLVVSAGYLFIMFAQRR